MRLLCPAIKLLLAFCVISGCWVGKSFGQSYGLSFASHEVFQDKRTGVSLGANKTFNAKNNLSISFDLSFAPNREIYFGYVVRIIEDDQLNIDLVYNAFTKKFNVIAGDKLTQIQFGIDSLQLFRKWNKLNIELDAEHDRIILNNGRQDFAQSGMHLRKNASCKVFFGVNNYNRFQTTDVPPMKVRDVKLSEDGQLKYNWPFDEESGNIAHETIAQNDGAVFNPVWVSALHRDWQSNAPVIVNGIASAAFNAEKNEVYVVGSDSLYVYSVPLDRWTTFAYKSGKIELNQGNQSIYNPADHLLYYIYTDKQFVARLNLVTYTWDKQFSPGPVTERWHFNKFFSLTDSSLYVVNGYGQLKYKNEVSRYHLTAGKWESVKASSGFSMPRYLAGLGATAKGDTAYILGGYGSSTGQQILNPKNIYDMMRFTVKDRAFKKMFELKVPAEDFALANSLIIDAKSQNYYGLIFPQHKYQSTLQLISGSLTKGDYTAVGGTIPYSFHDTHSFADLYYNHESQQFVAVTLLRTEHNQTKVNVYTLLGPPYAASSHQYLASGKSGSKLIWAVVGLILAGIIAWYIINSKKKQQPPLVEATPEPQLPQPQSQPLSVITEATVDEQPRVTRTYQSPVQQPKNAIYLFGDLQIFDASGTDITKYFTPLIKELFLVMLLYSIRWGRGLSSDKLNEILWYDKSAKSARNNRSVNIAKLKTLLERIDSCIPSKDTGYWKIDIDYNSVYVDYRLYLDIVSQRKSLDADKINELSAIMRRGNFLSNVEYEWLDTFKSETSNDVVNTYLNFAHSGGKQNDPEFLIELANHIFSFDPVNEEAMVIKCKALSTLGKHSLAKNTFENFIKEYKLIYGEDFKRDFHQILE